MKAEPRASVRACLLAGVAAVAFALDSGTPAVAADDATVQNLLQKLEERDAAILDLVKRVQQLEQRVGAAEAPGGPSTRAAPPAAGAAAAGGAAAGGAAAAPRSAAPAGPPAGPPASAPAASAPATGAPTASGAPAAPGTFAVNPEDAERALERTLVQAGALLLPFGAIDVEPGFTYFRQETSGPIFVPDPQDDELVIVTNRDVRENELTGFLDVRAGLPWGFQLEVGVPYTYLDQSTVVLNTEESNSTSGFGDISVGIAKEFLRERGWRPDLLGRVTWGADTGKEKDDLTLGSGFHSLTGSLTALKRQDPLAFVANGFYRASFEKDNFDAGDEFGFLIGTVLAASPDTSLSLSLQQTFAGETSVNGRSVAGSDQVSSLLVIGAASVLGRGVLLSFDAGIGLTDDAPDYFVGVSLPIRFNVPVR